MIKFLKSRDEETISLNNNELLKKYRLLSEELAQLKRENSELKRQNEKAALFKREFLGNISHEIKTPFYGILNSVSLLKNIKNLSPDDNFNLKIIEQNSQYLLTVFNDILDYYSIDNNGIKLENVNFSLKSEITPLLEYYRKRSLEKGLEFKVELSRNIPGYLKGDPLRIKQIIHQLLSNSIKYTEEGSISIKINAYIIDHQTFDISISVTDTGTGIDEERKIKMWQMFSFAGEDTDDSSYGIGIGLSLIKKLVELMNGKITVDSKKGIGSTFMISIPLRIGVSDSKELYKNILLVEDNIINQKLTKAILERQGFNVDTASNGRIGVEKYRQNNYDLILMDIQMPVMDGYESSRKIREYEKLNPLKKPVTIVAVSANSDKNNRPRLNEAGIDYFINKPFNIEKFSMLLNDMEGRKR
jgi:signal transduction histidine kinase